MVAQFDLVPIVDLIRLERIRAKHCAEQADRSQTPEDAFPFRTAAFWHNRTADLLEKAIPAAKGWRADAARD
jgi:hypothetical protein